MVYRLCNDSSFKYEIPLDQLPSKIQQMLKNGRYSSFYSEKLAIDPFQRKIIGLSMSKFVFTV